MRPILLLSTASQDGSRTKLLAGGLVGIFVLIAVLILPGRALAHAALVATDPADGAVLAQSPAQFSLTFSEPVSPLVLTLVRPDGSRLALTSFRLNDRTVEIDNPEVLKSGTHVLSSLVVSVDGRVIADTREALTLRETHFGTVHYIPRKDVRMSLLERTQHATYCPYKGECNYYSIPAGGERSVNAVWTYESPYEPVAQIKDHLAFYPDRVGPIEERVA